MSQNITQDETGWYSHKLEPESGLLYRHHPTKGIQWFSLSAGKWRRSDIDDSMIGDRWVEFDDTKDEPQEDDQ